MIFVTDNQVTLFLNGSTLSTHLLILFQINISFDFDIKKNHLTHFGDVRPCDVITRYFASNKNLNYLVNRGSLSGKFGHDMKRKKKEKIPKFSLNDRFQGLAPACISLITSSD